MASTNSYHTLVKAAASLVDLDIVDAWSDGKDVSWEEVGAFFQKNQPALDDASQALCQHCEVPLEYTDTYFAKHVEEIVVMRALARTFSLGSILIAENGFLPQAVEVAVDILKLANANRRGGLVVDFLLGHAFTGIGIADLCDLRAKLKPPELKYLIAELASIEDQQEPLCDIVERDKQWEAKVGEEREELEWDCTDEEFFKWIEKNPLPIDVEYTDEDKQEMLADFRSIDHTEKREPSDWNDDIDKRSRAMLRMLAVDLAIRSFNETHGLYPATLEQLKEDFPETNITDPVTNAPLIYQVESDEEFSLASAGESEVQGFSLDSEYNLYDAEFEAS